MTDPSSTAQLRAADIRPGDVLNIGEHIKVQRVEPKAHVLTGQAMFNVYREPDGRLVLSLYDTDSVTRVVAESAEEWSARVTRETVRRWGQGDHDECPYHPGERHGTCSESAR